MNKKEAIMEYEKILLGHINYAPTHFFCNADAVNKEIAIAIFKYAICNVLGWNFEKMMQLFDKKIIKDMKLDLILPLIKLPEEFGGDIDPVFFASLIFPERISYNPDKLCLETYKRLLSGRKKGISKNFFRGDDGAKRAKICLSYVLRNLYTFSSIEDIYEMFSDGRGRKLLSEVYMTNALENFESPVDLLHESLAESQQDDFLFHYYKFRYCYKKKKSNASDE